MENKLSDKHAYLIITHNDFESLKQLLAQLDDDRNDIYIHIDKKSGIIDNEEIRRNVRKSEIFFVPRMNVSWGHSSLVKCELTLLKEATSREHYHYYHLLSGVDFPLKSNDEIHAFFRDRDDEFISYSVADDKVNGWIDRVKYYYPFMKWEGKRNPATDRLRDRIVKKLRYLDMVAVDKQKRIGVDRTLRYKGMVIIKGDQWFSITDDFARFLLSKRRKILRMAFMTFAFDEFFVGTLAYNSEFRNRINGSCLRKIDWSRGNPYEFEYKDLEELLNCSELFARKIVYEKQPELVNALSRHISGCD